MSEPFGRYQLLKRIAGGGMGEVFLANQAGIQGFEKLLVIKTLLPHLAEDEEFVAMFLDEARLAAKLAHPNLIQIFDLGQVEDVYFIAMEYVHGEDLKRMWKQAYHAKRTIPIPIALRIVADAAAGLAYAHRLADAEGNPLGLVHRDVSPQNILLTFDGGVKLIDFGVAKAAGRATHTQTGALKGKYAYMSPEQAEGLPLDQRSDLFALGIVLWEMTTGQRLFRSDSDVQTLKLVGACEVPKPSEQNPEVPKALDPIILRALEKDRDARYANTEELRLAIENYLAASGSPGSSAHLAAFMRELFASRLEREGTKGPLADVDPDATGFSPLGTSRSERARPTSGDSSRNLFRPADPTGDLVAPRRGRAPVAGWALGVLGVFFLGVIAFALLRPKQAPVSVSPLVKPPATAALSISSTPPGAEVKIDGKMEGQTPLPNIELPRDRPVHLEIRKVGFAPLIRDGIRPPANLRFALTAVAKPLAQVALASVPPGATVFADGQVIGTTPAVWKVAASETAVTLTFKLAGYRSRRIAITPGKDARAEASLVRERHRRKGHPDIKMSR